MRVRDCSARSHAEKGTKEIPSMYAETSTPNDAKRGGTHERMREQVETIGKARTKTDGQGVCAHVRHMLVAGGMGAGFKQVC